MKLRAILEFELKTQDGNQIDNRDEYVWAAEATDDAIRSRLIDRGFLDDDISIDAFTLDVEIIKEGEGK